MATRALVTLYTDFTAAGGRRLGDLTLAADGGTIGYQLDQSGTGTIPVDAARWLELGGALRMVVRVTWPEGIVDEYRIARASSEDGDPVTVLSVLPVFDDLATCGPILQVVGGTVVTRLAGELAVSTWLATYFTPHAGVTRLGIAVGTLERDPVVPLDLDAATPRALLDALTAKEGFEWELVRTSETVWTLHGWITRGAALAPYTLREGVNQLALVSGVDDSQLVTVAVPLGEVDPDTGDRATMATTRYLVSSIEDDWVTLFDRDAGLSPILLDGQWVGAWVCTRSGFAAQILDSRASVGAVRLTETARLSVRDRLWIASDRTGAPCTEVWQESSLGAHGRRAMVVKDDSLRGEANEVQNGRFAPDMAGWVQSAATPDPAFVPIKRTDTGRAFTALADGGRGAGTSTATPLLLKGIPAEIKTLYRGDRLTSGGTAIYPTGDALSDANGAITIPFAGGISGNHDDNSEWTLERREQRTWLLDGEHSVMALALRFKDSGTDNVPRTPVNGALASAVGGYKATVDTIDYVSGGAGAIRAMPPVGWTQALDLGASGVAAFPLIYVTAVTGTGTASAVFTFAGLSAGSLVANTSRIRYYAQARRWCVVRVTAIVGAEVTVAAESESTVLFPGTAHYDAAQAWYAFSYSNIVLADNTSWTCDILRDTRTFLLNGAHTAGQTSLAFRAQANIATRGWQSTDELVLPRAISATLVIQYFNSITPEYETTEDGDLYLGQLATVVIDTAASTLDDFAPADWDAAGVWLPSTGSGSWRLLDITGSTARLFMSAGTGTGVPVVGTNTVAWKKYDTYAISGTPTWNVDGTVVVTLSAAIPAGRSYARGSAVWALPWHRREVVGDNSMLKLKLAANATDTTVTLYGLDGWHTALAPSATPAIAVFRVQGTGSATGSRIPSFANELFVAATTPVTAGGASVVLEAANPAAIANNDAIAIVRPSVLQPTSPLDGMVVRLMSPVGGNNIPTSSTIGLDELQRTAITVPMGQTVTLTAFVTVSLSTGTYPLGQQPAVALVDAAGAILNYARLADGSVQVVQTPTVARLIVSHTLTASTSVGVRVFGGATDAALWQAVLDVMWCVTTRDDVPFVQDAHGNALARRGADVLAVYRWPYATVRVELATLRRWFEAPATQAPIALGQPVVIPAYGLTRRVLSYVRALADPSRIVCEIGTVPTDQSRRVAGILTGS